MEQEYLDWKTNLPVTPNQLKVGTKFIIIKGSFKGRKGTIKDTGDHYITTDLKSDDGLGIIINNNSLDYIKLID